MVIDLVIDPEGCLIATFPRSRNGLELIRTSIGERDKLVEQVNRSRIEALGRNSVVRKDIRVSGARLDCRSSRCAHRRGAAWAGVKDISEVGVGQRPGKRRAL